MTTAEIRHLLDRTGVLVTQHADDPGYISPCWRRKLEEVCSVIDDTPIDAWVMLRLEKEAHEVTSEALASTQAEADRLRIQVKTDKAEFEKAYQAALRLIDEAMPRMRTLNNAMSPGWLARAAELRR